MKLRTTKTRFVIIFIRPKMISLWKNVSLQIFTLLFTCIDICCKELPPDKNTPQMVSLLTFLWQADGHEGEVSRGLLISMHRWESVDPDSSLSCGCVYYIFGETQGLLFRRNMYCFWRYWTFLYLLSLSPLNVWHRLINYRLILKT